MQMTHAARSAWTLTGLLAVAAAIGAYLWLTAASEGERAPAGALFAVRGAPQPMPPLAFIDDKGRSHTLADFRGKALLVNIWATWCAPCREEMPALDRLEDKLGGPGFQVIALSIDSGGAAAVRRFYEETGVRALAVYVDPAMQATSSLKLVGVPTTLLVDREGREIGRHTGPARWDGPDSVDAIKARLQLP